MNWRKRRGGMPGYRLDVEGLHAVVRPLGLLWVAEHGGATVYMDSEASARAYCDAWAAAEIEARIARLTKALAALRARQ